MKLMAAEDALLQSSLEGCGQIVTGLRTHVMFASAWAETASDGHASS